MAGAIAGTAILSFSRPSDQLQVVTVTVNNRCNLACPHCYLKYDGMDSFISDRIVTNIAASACRHVAVVGKEPLLDLETAGMTARLIRTLAAAGKRTSLITNGRGLRFLSDDALSMLAWVDVSLDGGPDTYEAYRKGSYRQVVDDANALLKRGCKQIRALHTLSSSTIGAVSDLMAIQCDAPWSHILFSPFIVTRTEGLRRVEQPTPDELLRSLGGCQSFTAADNATLLLDSYYLEQQSVYPGGLVSQLAARGLSSRVLVVEEDPVELGYIRVTYDGLILEPGDSLNPLDYRHRGKFLTSAQQLNDYYREIRLRNCA